MVIGIITILIAILLPVLARARDQANRVKCAANLRTIGHALMMYTQQYRYYPSCALYRSGNYWALWPVRLRPFLGGEEGAFNCPSQDERFEWKEGSGSVGQGAPPATSEFLRFGFELGEPLLKEDRGYFSYGYNGVGTGGGWIPPPYEGHTGLGSFLFLIPGGPATELPASRVRLPVEMIAVVDSTVDGRWDFLAQPNHSDPRLWPGRVHGGGPTCSSATATSSGIRRTRFW